MSGPNAGTRIARLGALAEILLVLALGNIAGVAIYNAVSPAPASIADAGGITEALYAGLRIVLRIGLVAAFGLALLWIRRGISPRAVGLTRAGKPLGHLIGVGIVLGGFSSFLIALVFAVHAVVPLGEGLAAWEEVRQSTLDTAFYADMLVTSILVPPLVEEIMARGYMRVRLVESYGRTGGVVLAGLVFAVAHGKFISDDPLLAIFLIVMIVSSIAWTYIAQDTGSLIPPMVAHAITNSFATLILFDVWAPFAAAVALVLWQRRPIVGKLRQFANDWRSDPQAPRLWFGVVTLIAVIAALMISISQFGRTIALSSLGVVALLVVIANTVRERRS